MALQQGHLQNLAEFRQALGGRAALNYTVTLVVQVAKSANLGPRWLSGAWTCSWE